MRHPSFAECAGTLALLFAVMTEFFSAFTAAQSPQDQVQSPLEITRVDLFSIKNWNSMQVSVLGLMLGMTRRETLIVALKTGLLLDDDLGQGCLKERTCNVFEGGKYNSVSLIYGESEILEKIRIEAYRRHAPKEERSGWLVSRLQGATRRLAESYSDWLRNQTLGSGDAIRGGKMTPPSAWKARSARVKLPAHREYQYRRLGLVLYVDLHEPCQSDDDIDQLTIEFVPKDKRNKLHSG